MHVILRIALTLGLSLIVTPDLHWLVADSLRSEFIEVEIVPESTSAEPGQRTWVALRMALEPGWHVYWRNPGDSGMPPRIEWSLPPGVTAGDIVWPHPHRIRMGPLVNFGYEDEIFLPVPLDLDESVPEGPLKITAATNWLICQEVCIPGRGTLDLEIPVKRETPRSHADWAPGFARARQLAAHPVPGLAASFTQADDRVTLTVELPDSHPLPKDEYWFYPYSADIIEPAARQVTRIEGNRLVLDLQRAEAAEESPTEMDGILVGPEGWGGLDGVVSILIHANLGEPGPGSPGSGNPGESIPENPTGAIANPTGDASDPTQEGVAPDQSDSGRPVDRPGSGVPAPAGSGSAASTGATGALVEGAKGTSDPPRPNPVPGGPAETPLDLITALGMAFLGGLILNLMPCVFPILSLKIMGFVRQSGENSHLIRAHGLAFALGVLVSFWCLAGGLLALRAGGQELGWGFQLQSPRFVLFLIFLFFVLGLSLAGVLEIGSSVTRLAGSVPTTSGLTGSFMSGVLATVIATPCTAPFMGPALGFAVTLPPSTSLLVFTSLGCGMATPYLVLSFFPLWLEWLPKPGAWMETFKQAMAFPMFLTAAWLTLVFGQQTSLDDMFGVELGLISVAFGAWVLGRWGGPAATPRSRFTAQGTAMASLVLATWISLPGATQENHQDVQAAADSITDHHGIRWLSFRPGLIEDLRASGRPVFVDFTATWCLTCQVNKKVVFTSAEIRNKFRDLNVAMVRGDWTRGDERITKALAAFERNGVPLNILYAPDPNSRPIVFPSVLSRGLILEALANLGKTTD